MNDFKVHSHETSPEASIENLNAVSNNLGFIPNVFAAIAESPEGLTAFCTLNNTFNNTTLSPEEQQIVMLAVSTENHCAYCVAGHTVFAHMVNMPEANINALRNMQQLKDTKLQVLNKLARKLVRDNGLACDADIQDFLNAGYTRQQFFEVVLGVCLKTFSNIVSISLALPLDPAFEKYAWEVPVTKQRDAA